MRDAKKGTYNGDTTYCPVNAYGDCPYCDQCNACHIDDPQEDCTDWQMFFDSWEEWVLLGEDEEPDYDDHDCDYEVGFDPYMGCFTDDC